MRIISGTHRGRRLHAPKGMATRPTTDRVREALFSILGNISDAQVVDCYSGTGALGIEAVSRGARGALLIEADSNAAQVIRHNLTSLQLNTQCTVLVSRVERSSGAVRNVAPIDLVLSDPPWPNAQQAANDVVELVIPYLANDALLVLGHRASEPVSVPGDRGLELIERRRWGDSGMSFFRVSG